MPEPRTRIVIEVDPEHLDAFEVGAVLVAEITETPTHGTGYGNWPLTVISHEAAT